MSLVITPSSRVTQAELRYWYEQATGEPVAPDRLVSIRYPGLSEKFQPMEMFLQDDQPQETNEP